MKRYTLGELIEALQEAAKKHGHELPVWIGDEYTVDNEFEIRGVDYDPGSEEEGEVLIVNGPEVQSLFLVVKDLSGLPVDIGSEEEVL